MAKAMSFMDGDENTRRTVTAESNNFTDEEWEKLTDTMEGDEFGPMKCVVCGLDDMDEIVQGIGPNSNMARLNPICLPCLFLKASTAYNFKLNTHHFNGQTWVRKVR
jgi:hypothetical protein